MTSPMQETIDQGSPPVLTVDGARAIALGLPQPPPLKQIVAQYLEDFGKR